MILNELIRMLIALILIGMILSAMFFGLRYIASDLDLEESQEGD